MHAITPARHGHHHEPVAIDGGPFPWEEGHAAPEDRAVGLELELIELVRRRTDIRDGADPAATALDGQIDAALAALGDVTPVLTQPLAS